uniref:Uncharacterized protein n=1 Tax=Mimivirus LCMiAC01 TaxID=2506608 RepID=A0A481YZW2_9VIRU|nr:MAG: hypothetical protein LCMiAC01_04400 [Mimivirus LCMiAC01]
MSQTDITITKDGKIIGHIWKNILFEHSDIIKKSIETIDNFDGDLIKTIDIDDICQGTLYCYDYTFEETQVDWENIFNIINGQNLFFQYNDPKCMTDKILNDLLYVRSIAGYFLMNKLHRYCNTILVDYTKTSNRAFLFVETNDTNSNLSNELSEYAECMSKNQFMSLKEDSAPGKSFFADFISRKSLSDIKKHFASGKLPTDFMVGYINSPYKLYKYNSVSRFDEYKYKQLFENTMCILMYKGSDEGEYEGDDGAREIMIYICETPSNKLLQYISNFSNKHTSLYSTMEQVRFYDEKDNDNINEFVNLVKLTLDSTMEQIRLYDEKGKEKEKYNNKINKIVNSLKRNFGSP